MVAQSLEYASWVDERVFEDFDQIALKHRSRPLQDLFQKRFGTRAPNELDGTQHRIVIVSSELDQSSERIVKYLATKHELNINAVFFKFFRQDGQEFLGRAWLMDPEEVEERSQSRRRAPWSGFWFVNVGEGDHRNWDDNRKYGFIGAGQGERFSQSLQKLSVGDRIFAYMGGLGYVGLGEVVSPPAPVKDFVPPNSDKPLLHLPVSANKAAENADDPAKSEWAVGVRWLKTFLREQARTFKGVFANPNIVCKLRDQQTLEFLEREFGVTAAGHAG